MKFVENSVLRMFPGSHSNQHQIDLWTCPKIMIFVVYNILLSQNYSKHCFLDLIRIFSVYLRNNSFYQERTKNVWGSFLEKVQECWASTKNFTILIKKRVMAIYVHKLTCEITFWYFDAIVKEYIANTLTFCEIVVEIFLFSVT